MFYHRNIINPLKPEPRDNCQKNHICFKKKLERSLKPLKNLKLKKWISIWIYEFSLHSAFVSLNWHKHIRGLKKNHWWCRGLENWRIKYDTLGVTAIKRINIKYKTMRTSHFPVAWGCEGQFVSRSVWFKGSGSWAAVTAFMELFARWI